MSVLKVQPLQPNDVAQFSHLPEVDNSSTLGELLSALGHAPLFMRVASCLMESASNSAEEIKRMLLAKGIDGQGTVSISFALGVLLELAFAVLETQRPGSTRVLVMTALFDVSSVSHTAVDCLLGDDLGEAFTLQAAALGICDQRWDEGLLIMHSSIARILRKKAEIACVEVCIKFLLLLWPRRWRGAGSSMAHELMRHTRAICEACDARHIPLNEDLLLCFDRGATLLALNEGENLPTPAELWLRVIRVSREAAKRDVDAVRIGRACGRLLQFLRDERAGDVLRYAFELACEVNGKQSAEASLILGCNAPYLPASGEAVQVLQGGVAALENRMVSADTVLGKEEGRMLQETVFVLLVRQGQMLQEMGKTVPASPWAALQEVEQRIQKSVRSAPW
ncbi:hypothetical protein TraAM80_06919 [Trypanosoma rangeli]|uniref:Uncharacterized protein n=1 Tax=Trypanosoma rangeli TaxID=5698 RepID=A0A422N7U6_TRYRA|nr:uncharacterized protein TraAM80_06919 [Trypanosoma rangeli]RNF01548.1 hypothetical protein TraAM80_06919 [Trypanosoma rangeli]|eukprot:RNF01548.1 hypothetical protein TraAM80_06919 [Trypanosoma rangeli]